MVAVLGNRFTTCKSASGPGACHLKVVNLLSSSVESHPQLNFTVIVNPASGPGSGPYPDENYTARISRLNSYSNVKTIGYVSTDYAARNLTEIIEDVATYGGWGSKSDRLAMHGIFCDESPHQFSEQAAEYMRNINDAIKSTAGLRGDRMAVHNPGVVPDAVFDDPNTDVTVVFEGNDTLWEVQQSQINEQRTGNCIMLHSLPEKAESELENFVHELASKAQYLFLTSNTVDYYESFGSDWANFTEAVATEVQQ